MSEKSFRPASRVRLVLSLGALAFLMLALYLIHRSATTSDDGVSYFDAIIACNVIAAAFLIGALAYARPATTLRVIAWLFAFLLLVVAQLFLDAHLYSLFGGSFRT